MQVQHPRILRHIRARSITHRLNLPLAEHNGLILPRRRPGSVNHAHVRQSHHRRIDRDELLHVGGQCLCGSKRTAEQDQDEQVAHGTLRNGVACPNGWSVVERVNALPQNASLTVRSPTVPSLTVLSPTVPSPTIHSPTVHSPTVASLTVPSPTVEERPF